MAQTSKQKKHHIIKGSFPFPVKKSPFYYGWIILVVGSLGILFSIPGQTMGVSVFTDYLIEALDLSRIEISTAYMTGTLASAFIMTFAGLFFDKFGARVAAIISAFFLGLSLFYLARSPQIASLLTSWGIPGKGATMAIMIVGFFGIRFFGQGVLTLVSRGMVMRWFDEHRGFAAALMGIFTSFGFSSAPIVLQYLIDGSSWSASWDFIAIMIICLVLPFIFVFFRDCPEDCGLEIEEGFSLPWGKKEKAKTLKRNYPLSEARKDPQLWFYLGLLFYWAMYNTAFTFHITSIFGSLGVDKGEAVAIFFPIAILSVISRFIGSWLSDMVKMRNLFWALIIFCFFGALAIALPYNSGTRFLLILSMGFGNGVFGVLTSVTWPKLYGREHLGAISGFAMSFIVAGSAVGPLIFGLMEGVWGHYRYTGWLGMSMILILGLTSLPTLIQKGD